MDPFASSPIETVAGDEEPSRQGSRDSLFLMAELCVPGRNAVPVRVRNLSAGGLMAEYAAPLEVGSSVGIDLRGIGPVTGRVAWHAAGRIGVSFDGEIDPLLARKPIGADKVARRR